MVENKECDLEQMEIVVNNIVVVSSMIHKI